MADNDGIVELYRKYRPRKLDDLVGQPEAVKAVQAFLRNGTVPHALLLTGDSGTGKTTTARILKRELGCKGSDFTEINAAESRGIDMVRDVLRRWGLAPLHGPSRIWLIDECQKLTGDAQSSMLKMLEDVHSHCYFMLATTDPHKLLNTIRTRCTEIRFAPLTVGTLEGLVRAVAQQEGQEYSPEVYSRIAEVADGSARKALVLLHQVLGLASDRERLQSVESSDIRLPAIQLARVLMDKKAPWSKVAAILKGLEGEKPEGLRKLVLAYAASVVLGGGPLAPYAYTILLEFDSPFYDSERPGLVRACYAVKSGH